MLITSTPGALSAVFLKTVGIIITIGESAGQALKQYCKVLGMPAPPAPKEHLDRGEALFWHRGAEGVRLLRLDDPRQGHQRHIRKYAQGVLGEDKSFYFRGPQQALRLRAHNLIMFLQLAQGVDDATWLHHLRQGDYSRWFHDALDDQELAEQTRRVEAEQRDDAQASRAAIRDLVNRRYTAPEDTL